MLNETKVLIDTASQSLVQYLQDGDVTNIEATATQFREIGGAMLFFNADAAQNALNTTAKFIQERVETATAINADGSQSSARFTGKCRHAH